MYYLSESRFKHFLLSAVKPGTGSGEILSYSSRVDGLRFIAILMIFIHHFAYYLGKYISPGFYGVNLFFVISGFLITSILLKDNDENIKTAYIKFVGRRILRIFPIYYLMILVLVLLGTPKIWDALPHLFTYTYNYYLGRTGNWDQVFSLYWSLSVEEQFYLFFPVIVLIFRRRMKLLAGIFTMIILVAYAQSIFNTFSLAINKSIN